MEMKIFISHSGSRGNQMAEALREWLPMISHRLRPWLSSADIGKGSEWHGEIRQNLKEAGAAIICLTPESLLAPWILFEAGALSIKFNEPRLVCPILLDLNAGQLKLPLSQFQATSLSKDDMFVLAKGLCDALGTNDLTERQFQTNFDAWWPHLESKLDALKNKSGYLVPNGLSASARDLVSRVAKIEDALGFFQEQMHSKGFAKNQAADAQLSRDPESARDQILEIGEKILSESPPGTDRAHHLAELMLMMQHGIGDIRERIDSFLGEDSL